jgi:hypothetical protein
LGEGHIVHGLHGVSDHHCTHHERGVLLCAPSMSLWFAAASMMSSIEPAERRKRCE